MEIKNKLTHGKDYSLDINNKWMKHGSLDFVLHSICLGKLSLNYTNNKKPHIIIWLSHILYIGRRVVEEPTTFLLMK